MWGWFGGEVMAGRRGKPTLTEQELTRWRLIEAFQERLARAGAGRAFRGSLADPGRCLREKDDLSLLLFGLFNPVVDSMRGRCGASALGRVQRDICSHFR